MKTQHAFTVTELTGYIKEILESDVRLSNLWLRGEVSNVSKPTSGHLYLTIKDDKSLIKAVMFKSNYQSVPFDVENGLEVLIRGSIGIYSKSGIYQCYIQEMLPQGMGSLELAFQQLKEKLREEGLFDSKYKKELPRIPQKIGLITSPTGSVIKDFTKVVARRFPLVDIFLLPVMVQGETSVKEISEAIGIFNDEFSVDLIVLARGGGSLEELWSFNTEEVARSIFASRAPVVSAIGHETDFTISDMVADLRAATPSVAGELVVPSVEELKASVKQAERQLYNSSNNLIQVCEDNLFYNKKSLRIAAKSFIDNKEIKMINLGQRLHALSPFNTLNRGYAICVDDDKNNIINSDNISLGQKVGVQLQKGFLVCRVEDKKEDMFDEGLRKKHEEA